MYWKVKDKDNNTYYMIHIKDDIYTKISKRDINKILNFKDSPVMSALPDDQNKRLVFHGHEAQSNINEFRAKNVDSIKESQEKSK